MRHPTASSAVRRTRSDPVGPIGHLLLWLPGPGEHRQVIDRAADLSRSHAAAVSVVVPWTPVPLADGCCGIQGAHWADLVGDHAQEDLDAAVQRLGHAGCRVSEAAVRSGERSLDVVVQAATEWSCDVVLAVTRRRRWSATGLSRDDVSALRQATDRRVIEVPT